MITSLSLLTNFYFIKVKQKIKLISNKLKNLDIFKGMLNKIRKVLVTKWNLIIRYIISFYAENRTFIKNWSK